MERYQIFISYRRDGGEFFGKILSDKLIAKGYSVFFDVEALRSGPFNDQLFQVIDQCQDFIVILSPHALDRCINPGDWVCSEIAYAIQQKKNIVPIVLRDFVWPEILPEAIRPLPLYEQEELARVTSHEHIDASVQRICRSLLKSRPTGSSVYRMADREFYKIKTHWRNPYKKGLVNRIGLTRLRAEIAETMRAGEDIPDDPLKKLKLGLFDFRPWYEANGRRLDVIRQLALELKAGCWRATGSVYTYYYANAVQFALCNLTAMNPLRGEEQYLPWYKILSYCLDWPLERLDQLYSALGDPGYEEFRTFLPESFAVWPRMYDLPSEERNKVEKNNILIFDFMVEFALLIMDTCPASQHRILVQTQILSYYKWLRDHKFYMPKDIQEKLFRYFQ